MFIVLPCSTPLKVVGVIMGFVPVQVVYLRVIVGVGYEMLRNQPVDGNLFGCTVPVGKAYF